MFGKVSGQTVFILSSVFTDSLPGRRRTLGGKSFPHRIWKALLHFLLASSVAVENSITVQLPDRWHTTGSPVGVCLAVGGGGLFFRSFWALRQPF